VELISNKHLSSISSMKYRYVGSRYMNFITVNKHVQGCGHHGRVLAGPDEGGWGGTTPPAPLPRPILPPALIHIGPIRQPRLCCSPLAGEPSSMMCGPSLDVILWARHHPSGWATSCSRRVVDIVVHCSPINVV
jgi:hypothetical protein